MAERGFARPLLDVRKAELVDALRADGQDWMEDASNAEPKYKRNRVRLELLPLLDELAGSGGGLRARLAAAERQSAQLREWLEAESAARLDEDPAWTGAPPALREPAARGAAALQEELLHALVARGSGRRVRAAVRAFRRARDQLDAPSNERQLHVSADWALRRVGASHRPPRGARPPGRGQQRRGGRGERAARDRRRRAPRAGGVGGAGVLADEAPPPAGAVVLHNVAAGAELEPGRARGRPLPPELEARADRAQGLPARAEAAARGAPRPPLVCSGGDVLASARKRRTSASRTPRAAARRARCGSSCRRHRVSET